MTRTRQFSDTRLAALIDEHHGCQAMIAAELGVTRGAIWLRINASEELKLRLFQARETLTDYAVRNLAAGLKAGQPWATSMQLRSLSGQRQGYGMTRTEAELELRLNQLTEQYRQLLRRLSFPIDTDDDDRTPL